MMRDSALTDWSIFVEIACLDLEGVLIPEVWINFAERTGIDALKATTRDIPDYDELMTQRLEILREHTQKANDAAEETLYLAKDAMKIGFGKRSLLFP